MENRNTKNYKTDVLRSIGKQSGKSVESVLRIYCRCLKLNRVKRVYKGNVRPKGDVEQFSFSVTFLLLCLGMQTDYCRECACLSVCLFVCLSVSASVCPRAYLRNCAFDLHKCLWTLFVALARPPLAALRYVMYFRFMGDILFAGTAVYSKWLNRGGTDLTPRRIVKMIRRSPASNRGRNLGPDLQNILRFIVTLFKVYRKIDLR